MSLTGKHLSPLIVSGFLLVVVATGVESIVQDSINYVRWGRTFLVYGVYEDKARVSWRFSMTSGYATTSLVPFAAVDGGVDHRILLANLLFPSNDRMSQERKDNYQGNGAASLLLTRRS